MNPTTIVSAMLVATVVALIIVIVVASRYEQKLRAAEADLQAARDSLAGMTITEAVGITASEPLPGWVEVKFDHEPVVMVCLRRPDGSQNPAGRRFLQVIGRLSARAIQQG